MGLVEIDDRNGDISPDLRDLDLGAQRPFKIVDQLIANGLTLGQHPRLKRGIAAFNFAQDVVYQVLLLQQQRMRRAAHRVLECVDHVDPGSRPNSARQPACLCGIH